MAVINAVQSNPETNEDAFIAEQERLAQEEQARRAREEFEIIRQREIQKARMGAGLCIMCGRSRNWAERLTRRNTHRVCKVFMF